MPVKPDIHDFETVEEYLEALVDWKLAMMECRWLASLGIEPETDGT